MTGGWQKHRLGDVLTVQNGFAFDSKLFDPSAGTPLIRIRDLKGGTNTETRFNAGYDPKYMVADGDLLIGMDGEFGCYEWRGGAALLNQRVCRLQGFSDILLPRFLFYGVNAYLKAIEDVTGYTTVKHLSSKQILSIEFPTPPIAEQKRIVAILDEAFEGIAVAKANAERNVQNAHAVFDSFTNSVFGGARNEWRKRTLSELCVVDWGNTSLTKSSYVESGEYLAVSAAGCDGRIGHREHARHTPVLSAIGAQCGRMFLPTEDFTAIKNTMTFTPREGRSTGRFLYWLLRSTELPRRGAAQPFMSKGDVTAHEVVVPDSLSVQEAIADELEAFSSESQQLEALYKRKLEELEGLKKSLLNAAFSGNL